MDLTLNSAVLGVQITGIRQFTYLVRDTPGACALTIGEPDMNTPDVVKEAAKTALDNNDTHYPPGNGYPCKKCLSWWAKKRPCSRTSKR